MQITLSVTGFRRLGLAIAFALGLIAFMGVSLDLGTPASAETNVNGDVNGDGSITSVDAALILQFTAGLLSELPSKATNTPTNTPTHTPTPTPLDVSGTWDADYALTCDAVLDQEATELSAVLDCGGTVGGTLEGSADTAAGTIALSGEISVFTLSIEGLIVDDDSMGGAYFLTDPILLFPFAETGAFEAVRVDPSSGDELNGEWLMSFSEILGGGCTLEVEQVVIDLTGRLDCQSFGINLEGTLVGNTLSMMGPIGVGFDLLIETTVSEDGTLAAGSWEVTPPGMTGSFAASRR